MENLITFAQRADWKHAAFVFCCFSGPFVVFGTLAIIIGIAPVSFFLFILGVSVATAGMTVAAEWMECM